ncbi:MAG: BamA/TamA family outer membrane protein, partial [Burkholderiales bacterium]|nr:BamA/TamA family outer membrane protein [Burkholderiales bacterium]
MKQIGFARLTLPVVLSSALCLATSAQAAPLQVTADDEDVKLVLSSHLDLARALAQAEPPDALERERLCQLTPAQARQLMQTEGFYAPESIGLDCAAGRLTVKSGRIARLRQVELLADGVDEATLKLWERWLHETTLRTGRAFVRERWTDGKQELLTRVRAHGYPLARWGATEARVQAQDAQVDVSLRLESGPQVRFGPVRVQGLRHHDEARVLAIANLPEEAAGVPVSEAQLVAAQQRLLKSQLFDGALVELDLEQLEGDRAPVVLRLTEAPLQQLGLGLGWSNQVGPRATLEHQHRRFMGRPLRSTLRLALAGERQSLEAELSTHPSRQLRRNLAAARWEREQGEDAPYEQASLRLGQVSETREHDRAYYLEALRSRQGLGQSRASAEALLLHWQPTWRALDSVLLPTEGQLLSLQLAAGGARSRLGEQAREQGGLARVQARWQRWWPLDDGPQLSLRLEAGQVFAPSTLDVPESLRWRPGGDESVRGYRARELGPSSNGQEVGGRVLWTASLEAAWPLER